LGGGRTISRASVAACLASPARGRAIKDLWRSGGFTISSILVGGRASSELVSSKIIDDLHPPYLPVDRSRLWMGAGLYDSALRRSEPDLSREGQKLDHLSHCLAGFSSNDMLAAQLGCCPNDGGGGAHALIYEGLQLAMSLRCTCLLLPSGVARKPK